MSDSDDERNQDYNGNDNIDQNYENNKPLMESQFVASLTSPQGYDDQNFGNLRQDADEASKINIDCGSPQIIEQKFNTSKYVIYTIKGYDKNGEFNVKRRYSDFFELRKKMIENWPGIFVPSIPGKKQFGNLQTAFVTERCADLNFFLEQCSKRPYLVYSEEFQIFLRNANDNVAKFLESMRVDTPVALLAKYTANMEQFLQGQAEESKIDSFFTNLDKTVGYFKEFKETTRKLRQVRRQEKLLSNRFYNIMLIDIKSKCDPERYNDFNENIQAYTGAMDDDELKNYSDLLRQIEKEMKAF